MFLCYKSMIFRMNHSIPVFDYNLHTPKTHNSIAVQIITIGENKLTNIYKKDTL